MEKVDFKSDELYVLLLGQDHATENFDIADTVPDLQPPWEQLEGMERSDTRKVGVHDVEHVTVFPKFGVTPGTLSLFLEP